MAKFFTKNASDRIVKTVKTVENWSTSTALTHEKRRLADKAQGFWARLEGKKYTYGTTEQQKFYNWRYCYPLDPLAGEDTLSSDPLDFGISEYPAVESYGFKYCLIADNGGEYPEYNFFANIVWLQPAFTQNYLIFNYDPGVVLAKVYGGDIPAATGALDMGEGQAKLFLGDTENLTLKNTPYPVFNWTKSVIKNNSIVTLGYMKGVGWVITNQDCS